MDCSQTWLGFFLPSGRSYNCGILLGLEELLTSSPSYQLGRIVVLVLGLAKKFSRVLEWQFGVWGLFLQVLFPPKNKQNLCTLGVLTPFLIYWYADLLCVREKKKWIHSLCDQLFLIWSNSGIRLFWIHQLLLARHAQVTTSLGKVVAWLITLFLLLSFVIVLKLNFIWSCGILVVAWLPLQLFPYDGGFSPQLSRPNMRTPHWAI